MSTPEVELPAPKNVRALLGGSRAIAAYFLLSLAAVGFHLRLSIYSDSGSTLVPHFLILAPGLLLAGAQFGGLVRRLGPWLIALAILVLVHPLLAHAGGGTVTDGLRSGLQLLAAVIAAMALIYTASRLPARGLRKMFLSLWWALMGLAALETFGLRSQMRAITEHIYSGTSRVVYDSDVRDTLLYGRPRPTAFASEPSYLADSWIFMAALVFLLDRERGSARSWTRFGLMIAVGYVLAPSTSVFFVILAVVVWHFWPRGPYALAWSVAFAAVAVAVLSTPFAGRVVGILGTTETGSFFARVASPPHIGLVAVLQQPFFGFGIGNTAGVEPMIRDFWQQQGAFDRWPWYDGGDAETLMANGFWWQWVSLGVLGGVALLVITLKMLASVGVAKPFRTIFATWLIWYAGGVFFSPAAWYELALLAIPATVGAVSVTEPKMGRSTRSVSAYRTHASRVSTAIQPGDVPGERPHRRRIS
jgi:hypothetical protein